MKEEAAAFIQQRRAMAQESLLVAQMALDGGHLSSAVNRLYYACFYMVSALLVAEGHTSAKHSGIRALFDLHWIKTNRLPIEMAVFYRRIFKNRHEGDYDSFVAFAQEDVESWHDQAVAFVARIDVELERLRA